jgi:site-specific recombinase XerD
MIGQHAHISPLGGTLVQNQPLPELLVDLEQELKRLGYREGTLEIYRRRWQMLLMFAHSRGERVFSEQLGLDFVEHHFNILELDASGTLPQQKVQELRVVRMIGDFQLHRAVLRRYYRHKEILTDPDFISLNQDFLQHCREKDYAAVTIEHYVKQSAHFLDFAIAQGIHTCGELTQELINGYICTLAGYTYKTVELVICSLRAFFRFLLHQELVTEDFASRTQMVQARKQTRIPSTWTKEELHALIQVIDRGSPIGKRNYAIILLACSLGLRCRDIKQLKLDNFQWEQKQIAFTQSKTRQPLVLPLVPAVGWAIIDYLRYGRPAVESPYLFLRHIAPFLPFSDGDHLHGMIERYMRAAHLPTLKKRRGMHSLRHTAASVMLEQETPLAVISDILGHADTDSTAVYLKVDLKRLRACPLEIPGEDTHE